MPTLSRPACRSVVTIAFSAGLLMASSATALGVSPPQFIVPDRSLTGAVLPQDIGVGDFTSDGKTDVAVANLGPDAFNGGVSVLPGDGAGNLGSAIDTSVGADQGVQDIAPADFNEDGKLDLAAQTGTTGGPGPLYALLGTGTGTFTIGQQLTGGNGHVQAAELTGDGNTDIVFAYENGAATIRLFPGNGNGSFGPAIIMNRDWDAHDLELADVNGDGRLDIVGATGPVWVMLNQGGGAFSNQITTSCAVLCLFETTVADFNLDGVIDVAGVTGSEGGVKIGLGNGDGTFTLFKTYEDVSFATGWIASGDFTGDGRPDLLVNNEYASESNISVLMRGVGDGSFTKFTYWTVGNDGMTPVHLNADGRLDLVTYSTDPGIVYSTLNAGKGKFKAPQNSVARGVGAPDMADLDGDGLVDVVMAAVGFGGSRFVGQVNTYFNQGNGRFSRAVVSTIQDPSLEAFDGLGQIVLADVNEDGKHDLVAGFVHLYPKAVNIWVLFGDGAGRFTGLTKYYTGSTSASNQSIAVGDVNGDANLDIVGHTTSQLAVLPGNGDGTFDAAIPSGSSGSTQPGLHLADFTGDGVLDAAAIVKTGGPDFGSGDIRLHRGNGDGTFTLVQTRSFDGNPGVPGLVADLNNDGRPDLGVSGTRGSNGGRSGMRIALNVGGPKPLAVPVFYPSPPFPGVNDAADFDLDGDIDIAGGALSAMAIALNDGKGAFTGPSEYIPPDASYRLAADFTGDGKPDVFSINSTDRPLFSLYVNSTPA